MAGGMFQRQPMIRYLCLQLPGWAAVTLGAWIAHYYQLVGPPWLIGLVAAWIVKDLAVYPFVWRAYCGSRQPAAWQLVGERGRTVEVLQPGGYIVVHGRLWRAELQDSSGSLPVGSLVKIVDVAGITLLVEPWVQA